VTEGLFEVIRHVMIPGVFIAHLLISVNPDGFVKQNADRFAA
jgi:hypothetical protein